MTALKTWTLEDGSKWTSKQLAELLGCSVGNAYSRLSQYTTIDKIFKPMSKAKKIGRNKVYILDDGSEWTSPMLAEELDCPVSTAASRLTVSTNPDKVLAPYRPLNNRIDDDSEIIEYVERRNYYDKDGFWKLINKNT